MVTGGCGFIGSNLIRWLLAETDAVVTNLDLLTYAGRGGNLDDLEPGPRYRFVRGDVADPAAVAEAAEGSEVVFHLAAETHVDRSIEDPGSFVRTNVLGTQVVLEWARAAGARVVLVSTDEVYGALGDPSDPPFTEDAPLAPNSPYAASKAAAELLARAWRRTYGLDVVITRCSNNYGPYQFPEKFLPLMIVRAMEGEPLPIYGDGQHRRDWLHVEDHCRGLAAAWKKGRPGGVYNFGTGCDRPNLEMARLVLRIVEEETGARGATITRVTDRPGHDRRYAVDTGRARRELGWQPQIDLVDGLRATVRWYRDHRSWWQRLLAEGNLVDRRVARALAEKRQI
ncbi:MAG: dTDP-glucose 4,6-dehydratase [Acidobacteria bacterium]|nr:MAG: dTDP-glucose 4,6-dehydratase [Acidobacteriota bacterium]